MSAPLLEISGLNVAVDGDPILNGVDLVVRPGEVHAVMGPNGSGKSSLCHVLAGTRRLRGDGRAHRLTRARTFSTSSPTSAPSAGSFSRSSTRWRSRGSTTRTS